MRISDWSSDVCSSDLPDRFFDEIARDLLDVAADIAHFGELGRLDLDERRIGELRQTPRNLGLAAAGGADHEDVLGRPLVAQIGVELLPAPAAAQRAGDRALGVLLAESVLVGREFRRATGRASDSQYGEYSGGTE